MPFFFKKIYQVRILACQILVNQTSNKKQRDEHVKNIIYRVNHFLENNRNIDLIIFPELSTIDYNPATFDNLEHISEPINGESFQQFSNLAKKNSVYVVYGFPQKTADSNYITQSVIDTEGKYLCHYNKIHIAQFGASTEKLYFSPGNHLCTFEIKGIKTGIIICYDFRFSSLIEKLTIENQVELILHPVAFYKDASYPAWHHFVISRAVEFQVFFLSLNRSGKQWGNSVFCPPWYDSSIEPIKFGFEEEFKILDVDINLLKGIRKKYPFRKDRLEDYSQLKAPGTDP